MNLGFHTGVRESVVCESCIMVSSSSKTCFANLAGNAKLGTYCSIVLGRVRNYVLENGYCYLWSR